MTNTSWAPHYLIRWLFEQDTIWITAKGEKRCVQTMDRDHALNTILMLERVRTQIEPFLKDQHIWETPLYAALKQRVLPSDPSAPEGARFAVETSDGQKALTVYLREQPQDAGKGAYPWTARGWDPELGIETAIYLTDREVRETLRPV